MRTDDGAWVQGALLAVGLARVHSLVNDRVAVADMLAIERQARASRLGIWSQPDYRVRAAGEAEGGLRSFQLVEGRVRAAAVVRGRGYLNFGEDWREDFTVSIAPRDRRRFEAAGIAVEDYEGRLVRVRGLDRVIQRPHDRGHASRADRGSGMMRPRFLAAVPVALALGLALAAAAPLLLSGCNVNPATGEEQFTAFMPPEAERRVGGPRASQAGEGLRRSL